MKKSFIYSILALSVSSIIYGCPSPDITASPTPSPTAKTLTLGASINTKLADFTWTKYNLKFKLPITLKETKNDDTEFIAENSAVRFDLLLWPSQKLTQDDVLAEGIKNINLDKDSFKLDNNNIGTVTVNTLPGFIVSGSATENGVTVNLFIITIKDSVNAYIANVKVYPDKLTQDDKDINVMTDIFNSFIAPVANPSPTVSGSSSPTVANSPSPSESPTTSPVASASVIPGASPTTSPVVSISPTVLASATASP